MGRAWAYALAAGGQEAVAHVLKLIDAEMRVAMALTGVTKVSEINELLLEAGGNHATF
jgi:L-lactate dehydrogenase (cytochrome)